MTPIRRLAVVDRGEPAVRLLTAVGELNRANPSADRVATIVVYTEPDRHSRFVREADESICLGSATYVDPMDGRRRSRYLDEESLVAALVQSGADAVWPGWGFVAQSASFIERCEQAGIVFVGPDSRTVRLLADRRAARRLAESVGVPVVPWSGGAVDDVRQAERAAGRIGYPVLVKAMVGGGRGGRVVAGPDQLTAAFAATRAEAELASGDPSVFLEPLVPAARHVEAQVVADGQGGVWALGVRDCSVQLRQQKVIEESSSTALDAPTEAAVRDAACRLAAASGYRGAGTVEFLLEPATGTFRMLAVSSCLQAEHAVTEATTGVDLVKLQLHLAAGGRLAVPPPQPRGHAVEARLCAEDPAQGFVPAPGRLAALRLPCGAGIRVDTGFRAGDVVPADDSMIAKVVAWGSDRGEALARLRRALDDSVVVLEEGTSNRAFLLALLGRPELADGRVDTQWLDRLTAHGEHLPAPDPVALLVAAVEAYDAAHAGEQAAFYSSAARGRPKMPDRVGARVQLRYGGATYRVAVYRTSPQTYRVQAEGGTADLSVERLGRYERRVTTGSRSHRVLAVAHGDSVRVELGGAAHHVVRDDGGVVRAGWPAFVVSVRVAVGDEVAQGDPVAVLESMKMESAVPAPFAGTVTGVDVVPNAQVDAGAPLVRIRAAGTAAPTSGEGRRVDLSGLVARPAPGTPPCERVFGALRSYLLGYDLDAETFRRLLVEQRRLGEIAPTDDPGLLDCENALLDLFAEISSLYRPQAEAVEASELGGESTQEYLLAFLRWRDVERAGLPPGFVTRLEAALTLYGVRGLDPTPERDAALLWMFRSFARVRELVPVVLAVLERRLRAAPTAPFTDPLMRSRLERLAVAATGRYPTVAELARDVRFHHFDEPVLEALVARELDAVEATLDELAADPDGPHRAPRVAAVVSSPQPQRSTLLRRWMGTDDPRFRTVLLEIYARRFYRTRALGNLRVVEHAGHLLGVVDYDVDDKQIHLVVGYAPLEELPSWLDAVAEHLREQDPARGAVLDVSTWRDGEQPDADTTVAGLLPVLAGADLGRRPWRIDVTVTSTAGVRPERFRTQHMSFRPGPDGTLAEDPLYRNLHPMLAKRLDLWRLANFRLERLPSAEDVYLFHGVAHDNPKDRRLFALAEVRDLTTVETADGLTHPWLERMGLQALAAMRIALARFSPRERPQANRIVLYVRPPWNLPRHTWPSLARAFAPLAEGAGLEKVVLRVAIPEPDGSLRDTVLHVDEVAGGGVSVRELPPGSVPVRPLTRYRQNVLAAERFGVPYPYEIVRMLAPDPGDASGFPPGRFVEHDLGPEGTLVPVDREPGHNVANVVVGLLTSVTEKVPEGMTRVALLSDPTRGLGNLAEPECRRVLAALELAERLQVPVEWFAVSSGALIAMDTGTENMDWIADVLRALIEFTQRGGEVNIVVTGINVGGQPYWNAEATMLMHTRGILVMTPGSAMVLTGKQALDFSGGVSAEDNFGIGGFDRVMGPNGQAQYWAPTFEGACRVLLRHYEHTYVVPGERFPRRARTTDPVDRDVRDAPHTAVPGSDFQLVGDVFSDLHNPGRKRPFDIRSVMRAVSDRDAEPLERWARWRGAETSVVWDAHVGGIPVCMLGLESRTLARRGYVPADGPVAWTSGTLFPQSSRKTARAINATSGNRPLVVLANLSGFDGSPESMRRWQLEYGAEIGRAVTNFDGPIVFVVVSRYHGGAFVVFSKRLNEHLEIAAVEGSYASVIGGAPAAATVFAREVRGRTEKDPGVAELREALGRATGSEAGALRAQLARATEQVRSQKLGEVAEEFDRIHTIQRALSVRSVDRIIPAAQLRPYVVDALERGMAPFVPSDGGTAH